MPQRFSAGRSPPQVRSRRGRRGCDLDVKMFLFSWALKIKAQEKYKPFLFLMNGKMLTCTSLGPKNAVKRSSPQQEHLLLVELVEFDLL